MAGSHGSAPTRSFECFMKCRKRFDPEDFAAMFRAEGKPIEYLPTVYREFLRRGRVDPISIDEFEQALAESGVRVDTMKDGTKFVVGMTLERGDA